MSRLNEVDVVVNPCNDVWKELVVQCNATDGWSFAFSDYNSWSEGFKGFWFYAAIEKGSGKLIASITLAQDHPLNGQQELFSIGMYYCIPDWRGSGIGSKLFNMAMSEAGDANVTLMGMLKMAPLYASKFGFDKLAPFVHSLGLINLEDFSDAGPVPGITTKTLSEVSWDDIVAYDRTILNRDRSVFLKKWIDNTGTYTKVAFDAKNKITGLCSIRESIGGNLFVRPLYANNLDVAQTLISSTYAMIPRGTLYKFKTLKFVFPSVNTDAAKLVNEFSRSKGSVIPRLQSQFTKNVIETSNSKVYGVIEPSSSFV